MTESSATIVHPLQDTPYGSREFSLKDPEGHRKGKAGAWGRTTGGSRTSKMSRFL